MFIPSEAWFSHYAKTRLAFSPLFLINILLLLNNIHVLTFLYFGPRVCVRVLCLLIIEIILTSTFMGNKFYSFRMVFKCSSLWLSRILISFRKKCNPCCEPTRLKTQLETLIFQYILAILAKPDEALRWKCMATWTFFQAFLFGSFNVECGDSKNWSIKF